MPTDHNTGSAVPLCRRTCLPGERDLLRKSRTLSGLTPTLCQRTNEVVASAQQHTMAQKHGENRLLSRNPKSEEDAGHRTGRECCDERQEAG